MRPDTQQLILAIRSPARCTGLSALGWSDLIATARSANLLGLLAEKLRVAGVACPVKQAARHLEGARLLSHRQRQSVIWEIHELRRTLAPLETPVTLLKGAAYAVADLPISRGRLFGDIDILVPEQKLGQTEMQLMLGGWASAKSDPYDQRYYREWMHELPPMTHVRRGTVLDVHHSILPRTARARPDPNAILERSRVLDEFAPIRIPCPEDLAVHCITHFMHEGELDNGLRALHDIDGLLRDFAREDRFWTQLVECAVGHELAVPVAQGLALTTRLLGTPVPQSVFADLYKHDSKAVLGSSMEWAYRRALEPEVETIELATWVARQWLYVRAHALRMPFGQLTVHLCRKALMRSEANPKRSASTETATDRQT